LENRLVIPLIQVNALALLKVIETLCEQEIVVSLQNRMDCFGEFCKGWAPSCKFVFVRVGKTSEILSW